jgi:hypothetical protein
MCDISNWDAGQSKTEKHYVNYNESPAVKRYAFESEKGDAPCCRTLLEITRDGMLRLCGTYDNEIKMTLNVEQVKGWAEHWESMRRFIAEFGLFDNGERVFHKDPETSERILCRCRTKGNWPALLLVKTSYKDMLMRNNYGTGCVSLNLFEIDHLKVDQLEKIVEDMLQVAAEPEKFKDIAPMWGLKNPFNEVMDPQMQVATRQKNVSIPDAWKADKNHPINQLTDAEILKVLNATPGV